MNGSHIQKRTQEISEMAKLTFSALFAVVRLRNQPLVNAKYQIVALAYTTVRLSLRQQIPSRFVSGIVLHFQQFLRAVRIQ